MKNAVNIRSTRQPDFTLCALTMKAELGLQTSKVLERSRVVAPVTHAGGCKAESLYFTLSETINPATKYTIDTIHGRRATDTLRAAFAGWLASAGSTFNIASTAVTAGISTPTYE
jgi:hypothetical protein